MMEKNSSVVNVTVIIYTGNMSLRSICEANASECEKQSVLPEKVVLLEC